MQVLNQSRFVDDHVAAIAWKVIESELVLWGRNEPSWYTKGILRVIDSSSWSSTGFFTNLDVIVPETLYAADGGRQIMLAARIGVVCTQKHGWEPQPHHVCPLRRAARYEWAVDYPLELKS